MTLKSVCGLQTDLLFFHILHIPEHADQVYYSDSFIFGDMKKWCFSMRLTDLNSVKMQC